MLKTKITVGILCCLLSSHTVVNAAATLEEWQFGTQCLEEAELPPHNLLCMAVNKNQMQAIMRAGFNIGTKTRQPWCKLIDDLGLRASASEARGKEGMADCDANDNYAHAFQRGVQVMNCMRKKVFTDYSQWGALATLLYYCGDLDSRGDCIAAVNFAKKLRGKEPECNKATGSLWRWTQGYDFVRVSLDSIYDEHCRVKSTKMLSYCESTLKDNTQCQSLYGTTK
jgi:hypothetical protein